MERWSYKPEVEGLSPSSGTRIRRQEAGAVGRRQSFAERTCLLPLPPASKVFTGRDSSQQNVRLSESVEFEEARLPHAPARKCPICFSLS